MKKNIDTYKKILILTNQNARYHERLVVYGLQEFFKNLKKTVYLYPEFKNDRKGFIKENFDYLSQSRSNNYKLTFDGNDLDIDNVDWDSKSGKLSIDIETSRGQIDLLRANLTKYPPRIDLIIAVNIKSIDYIKKNNKMNFILDTADIDFVGNIGPNDEHIYSGISTLPESIIKYLEDENLFDKISNDVSSIFAASIYAATNFFSRSISNSTFDTISKLSKKGFNYIEAAKAGNIPLDKRHLKLIHNIISNSKMSGNGTFTVTISDASFKEISLEEIDVVVEKIFADIVNVHLAVVKVLINEPKILVFSNNKNLKLNRLVQKYSGQGDNYKANFSPGRDEIDSIFISLVNYIDEFKVDDSQENNRDKSMIETYEREKYPKPDEHPIQQQRNDSVSSPTIEHSEEYKNTESLQRFEEADLDYDPLAPAQFYPEPIDLGNNNKKDKKKNNSPLPGAG